MSKNLKIMEIMYRTQKEECVREGEAQYNGGKVDMVYEMAHKILTPTDLVLFKNFAEHIDNIVD